MKTKFVVGLTLFVRIWCKENQRYYICYVYFLFPYLYVIFARMVG